LLRVGSSFAAEISNYSSYLVAESAFAQGRENRTIYRAYGGKAAKNKEEDKNKERAHSPCGVAPSN